MDEELKELLGEEIKREIGDLKTMTPGSNEHSTAVESIAKLYRLKIDETKNQWDNDEKFNRRMMEKEQYCFDGKLKEKQFNSEVHIHERDERFKRDQLVEQVKDRYFKLGVEVASLVLPLVFYASWMRKGFKFEETGTFTSTTFRGLFNRFKPTKK
jgi:hypothetical protein